MRARFEITTCTAEAMFEQVLALNDRFLSLTTLMDEEALRARFRRCPDAFHCLHRVASSGTRQLAGYFIVLPVNQGCSAALHAGTIKSGREIQLSDLAGADEGVAAVYLSVVCAVGARAQTAAIHGVVATLRELHATKNARYLFVRAATEAGARMLE
ncbi:MAG TPA: hypothetical protein VF505_17110, partial [Thermoanaerobaculia bacterium]